MRRGASPRILPLPPLDAPAVSAAMLDDFVRAERERLLTEAGLAVRPLTPFKRPADRPFTRAERDRVTLLFGGLTLRHEVLVKAGFEALGHRCAIVPTPCKADFQAGKEYGNNGQCNPAYFTVGALVNYLKHLRDRQGLSRQEILDSYVFLTAGACGPCRFGMYEAEFRLALRNAGFEGFRVLLFQQNGIGTEEVEAGISFGVDFALGLLNAFFVGDLLNEIGYHVRPYELVAGRTDEALDRCLAICRERLRTKRYHAIHATVLSRLLSGLTPLADGRDTARFLDQLRGSHHVDGLRECAALLDDQVEVDYTRPRPVVKVTGEFWAQTTEGDGNFRMFRFLEREGAEVLVEPIATWVSYLLHQVKTKTRDARGLSNGATRATGVRQRLRAEAAFHRKMFMLTLTDRVLGREYERLRLALGGTTHRLVDQLGLQRLAHPFYNSRSRGGEGHLEVAKAIYASNRRLAHMVLSLKPFGCLPSTQSDGAQAAVMAHYPDLLFLPIETSGEGDVHAYSRVQMALGEAKDRARDELREAVGSTGFTLDEIRAYVAAHRGLRRPLQVIPPREGVVGRAAAFCLYVGGLMAAERATGGASRAPAG